jgi:hypothetical protein
MQTFWNGTKKQKALKEKTLDFIASIKIGQKPLKSQAMEDLLCFIKKPLNRAAFFIFRQVLKTRSSERICRLSFWLVCRL